MAWLRIDDRVRTHPKIVLVGPAGAWFWFCGICYCREHLTDGFIPKGMLPSLAPGVTGRQAATLAAALVNTRLWHSVDHGYQIHDFLDWNPSKAEVLVQRLSDKDRKRTERGRTDGQTPESSHAHAGVRARASSSGIGPAVSSEESARETGDFDHFWESYPRRVGKDAARKAFERRSGDATLEAILAALEAQKASAQWQRDGGRYVPHPATWLNQGRWQDEVDASGGGLSQDEWNKAAEIRRKNYGRCPHEEPCESYDECVATIGLARRSGAA
jgi:hypothetical protein